jgi:hypothetical protein
MAAITQSGQSNAVKITKMTDSSRLKTSRSWDKETPPRRRGYVTFNAIPRSLIHKHEPVIHGTDAAAELGMPATETQCVDDLRAGATGRIGDGVAAPGTVAFRGRGIE